MQSEPNKEGLLKLLERNGLQQLITQLYNYPEVIEDWMKRSKEDWKEFYGFAGIDIYNYLHPKNEGILVFNSRKYFKINSRNCEYDFVESNWVYHWSSEDGVSSWALSNG
jgi:hypothetical protein